MMLKLGFDKEVQVTEDVVRIADAWEQIEGLSHKAAFRGLVHEMENNIFNLSERVAEMDICEYLGFLCIGLNY